MRVVSPEDHVDPRGPFPDDLLVLLGCATSNNDAQVGVSLLLGFERSEVAVETLVGVLSNGAGVDNHNVGVARIVGADHPVGLEQAGDPLGVVFVHLAPERANEVRLAAPPRIARLGHDRHPEGRGIAHGVPNPVISGRSRAPGIPG